MVCRAPTSATTCAGSSPTGTHLVYDAERRLKYWQNVQDGQPVTSQAWFMYDGEGHRVEQYSSKANGSHTYYLPGNVEEVTPSGSLIKYYSAGGLSLGENTASDASGSGISYLVSDGLGSVTEALNQTGTATGAQLYDPYGGVRYSSGTLPTAKGFTGQYADGSTGLDYYGARYYDPTLGQFTSADTVQDGLNRYGYVTGNPETLTDPTGHMLDEGGDEGKMEGLPPPDSTSSGLTGGGGGSTGAGGSGGSVDPIQAAYARIARYLQLLGRAVLTGGTIFTIISMGGGASTIVAVGPSSVFIYYQYRDGTVATFDATNTPVLGQWLDVALEHNGGAGAPGPARPGHFGVLATAGLTTLDRANNFRNAFGGSALIDSFTSINGYSTNVPAGRRGAAQIRTMDYNRRYRGDGPYFRVQAGTRLTGNDRDWLNFNGQIDRNLDHTHFYLGTGGTADDLALQTAIAATILYQYESTP